VRSLLGRIGSHPAGLWTVKHLISPLDRLVVKASRGRLRPPSSLAVPSLLLTVKGRRTGQERTIPLVFVRDGKRYVVANARPAGERRNPWPATLEAAGQARVRHGKNTITVNAHKLSDTEAERWWPSLVDVWPAFAEEFAATGERTVFVLDPHP
jgi:deazaflavin-dependent oxidoreductase (nitroreductase family)